MKLNYKITQYWMMKLKKIKKKQKKYLGQHVLTR
jgi:hypothetical protein